MTIPIICDWKDIAQETIEVKQVRVEVIKMIYKPDPLSVCTLLNAVINVHININKFTLCIMS